MFVVENSFGHFLVTMTRCTPFPSLRMAAMLLLDVSIALCLYGIFRVVNCCKAMLAKNVRAAFLK
ncbi:hypothetical protein ANCCAN_00090 [Ancylostoma caninum]|uniref:Uncharacterized protein n=1 Tax=Ancylostoma caninum TaxID=29170 RepID=A0A368HAN2_ANCCA|nr:hypothetical protein ANCCAN_00090 [Ancylostoma caninum]